MRVTREGVKGAASCLGWLTAMLAFFTAIHAGVSFFPALFAASLCATPFFLIESLFDLPELWRWYRRNWRSHAVMMAILLLPIFGLRAYQTSVGMSKEERFRTTVILAPLAPALAFVMVVLDLRRKAARKGP